MPDATSIDDIPTLETADPPAASEGLLASMTRIRVFEDEVMKLFSLNLVRGSTHLCQGQEAVTVGVSSVMQPGDTMTCTYRGHGATLALGSDVDRCFGEILGRVGGLARGRGGSMHFIDPDRGALGSNAIVGGHLPLSAGAALSAKLLGTGSVCIAYSGDGSTNIGAFHESVNLAAIWKLPVVFVIENNQYGEYSPLASTTPIARLADRAIAYGIPGVFVDGNDVVSMAHVAGIAIERARRGEGPTLIEANTYRQQGHSRSDPATYRPAGELEYWLAKDPIENLRRAMARSGRWTDEQVDAIHTAVTAEVVEAKDRALTWPEPGADERLRDVYA